MPEPCPTSKPACLREDALAVLLRLRGAGHVAYFAGGCVRDVLMGLEPKDWDVATDAPPQRVRQLFSNTQAVGAAFGVILVKHRRSTIEVATFRADLKYEDGRRPTGVRFTSAEEDARRRDFTINGLFLDPQTDEVIDYVGGRADIQARTLRAIGDPPERFEEDHLRMLRAVRFAARFEFAIHPATADAIRARSDRLVRISPERIADELRLMFALPGRGARWAWHALLREFPGLSDVIFRFFGPPPVTGRRDLPLIFEGSPADDRWPFGLCLAAISLDWARLQSGHDDILSLLGRKPIQRMVHALRQSLKISNEESDEMAGSLEGAAMLLRDSPPTVAVMKRFLARPTARSSRRLLNSMKRQLGAARVDALQRRLDELAATDYAPEPLLTGDDLIAAGFKPGPLFKKLIDAVYDEQLEGRVGTKNEALAFARRTASS